YRRRPARIPGLDRRPDPSRRHRLNRATARPWRWLAALLLAAALPAAAIDDSQLLPVDEAFALQARAVSRDRIEIDWAIAEGYYLYRHRTSVRETSGRFKANPLQLPDGKRHVDEFFGEVETYRQHLIAAFTGAAADGTNAITLEIKYQGCADLGICYPPQTRTLEVALPAAAAGTDAGGDSGFAALGRSLVGGAGAASAPLPGTDSGDVSQALPLPPEQAFGFEAIADGADGLLLRFTPARGYYLYRDRSSFRIDDPAGIVAGTPRWPRGVAHNDGYFGDVTVYFDQVDVPLPLRRGSGEAATVRLVATFQGCQDDGICYP